MANAASDGATAALLRPLCEGANIRTWVGFKHFMYLGEQAVLDWFRDREAGPSALFHRYGLGLSVISSSAQLPAVLDLDDVTDAAVTGGPERFEVKLTAHRHGTPTVLRARVGVALVKEADAPASAPPPWLAPLVIADVGDAGATARPDREAPPGAGNGATGYAWSWRVPYYFCQYSNRMQHSGYVRVLEEAVDRFLADKGLGIADVLRDRGWIPVVSRARVSLLADAVMGETMHTTMSVTDVLKRTCFAARMDCYVPRGRAMVHTASADILHAYAIARGESAGQTAELDDGFIAALTRGRPS
ncbi:MAG: thioesterase family protein [Streptosporangiaceae bacterium]|nr:thioesterase family protein [Streptosporangiaceae bacterium]